MTSTAAKMMTRTMTPRANGVGGRLVSRNTVFLCCDVQERFRPLIRHMDSVLFVGKELVTASNILQIPLIVTEQYPKALLRTCEELGVDREGATHAHHRLFEKTQFNMLTEEVRQHLAQLGRKQVVLFGLEAHVCVLQTALELIQHQHQQGSDAAEVVDSENDQDGPYEVHVVTDGTSSQRAFDRRVAFDRLSSTPNVYLTTMEMALFQILQTAKHPDFKEISALCNEAKSGPRPDPGDY